MAESYFAILGVSTSASFEEIRSAYRRLAKAYHPDHFKGDSGRFMRIQEAYAVLGDSRRRREYQHALDKSRAIGRARYHSAPGPYPYPGPEPRVPVQGPGPVVDLREISPARSFRTRDPFLDEIFEWLWGHDDLDG
jgi:molecular chaperone DnaJ